MYQATITNRTTQETIDFATTLHQRKQANHKPTNDSQAIDDFKDANLSRTLRSPESWKKYASRLYPYFIKSVIRHAKSKGYDFTLQELEDVKQDIVVNLLDYPKHVEREPKLKGILTFKVDEETFRFRLQEVPDNELFNKLLYKKVVYFLWAKVRNNLPSKPIEATLESNASPLDIIDYIESIEDKMSQRLQGIDIYESLKGSLTQVQFTTLLRMIEGYTTTATKVKQALRDRLIKEEYTQKDVLNLYEYYVSLKVIEKSLPATVTSK